MGGVFMIEVWLKKKNLNSLQYVLSFKKIYLLEVKNMTLKYQQLFLLMVTLEKLDNLCFQ